jgi:hypothetical protein
MGFTAKSVVFQALMGQRNRRELISQMRSTGFQAVMGQRNMANRMTEAVETSDLPSPHGAT